MYNTINTPRCDHLVINRFLGIPMNELLCKDAFDGQELLGNEVNEVNDQLGCPESVVDWDALIKIISTIDPLVRMLYCALF